MVDMAVGKQYIGSQEVAPGKDGVVACRIPDFDAAEFRIASGDLGISDQHGSGDIFQLRYFRRRIICPACVMRRTVPVAMPCKCSITVCAVRDIIVLSREPGPCVRFVFGTQQNTFFHIDFYGLRVDFG